MGDVKCRNPKCGQPHCATCRYRHTGDLREPTCPYCLHDTRTRLKQIPGLAALAAGLMGFGYPKTSPSVTERTSQNAEPPLQGGDVLALIGPGNPPSGLHVESQSSDPQPVFACLLSWERDWRRQLGLPGAKDDPTFESVCAWLLKQLEWAAKHYPEYPDFHVDIRSRHMALLVAANNSDRPERSAAECFDHPNVMLIQPWTDKGLADWWECPIPARDGDTTHRRYESGDFYLARRATIRRAQQRAHTHRVRTAAMMCASVHLEGVRA